MKLELFTYIGEAITSTRSTNFKQDVIADVFRTYNDIRNYVTEIDENTSDVGRAGYDSEQAVQTACRVDESWLGYSPVGERRVNEDMVTFVRFLLGERFDDADRNTNFQESGLYKAVAQATGTTAEQIEDWADELGKPELGVQRAYEDTVGGQATFSSFNADNAQLDVETIQDVYSIVYRVADTDGDQAKVDLVADLFSAIEDPLVAKWVAFSFVDELSLYMGESTVRDAMADVYFLDEDDVDRSAALTLTYAGTLDHYLENGDLRRNLRPGEPFRPMLADEEELADIPDGYVGQPKFDGARVLVHSDGDEISIYSRNGGDVTESLPEITEALEPGTEYILDGEAVAYDPETGDVLPFQNIMKRFRREDKVEEMRDEIEVQAWFFDCIYHNGPVDDRSNQYRVGQLRTVLREQTTGPVSEEEWFDSGLTYLSNTHVHESPGSTDLEKMYEVTVEGGHEGLVCKDMSAGYVLDRDEAWLKAKPSATVDLRVIDVERGDGQHVNRLGTAYIETADGVSLGNVGNGFSDEERERWDPVDGEESLVGRTIEVKAEEIAITGDGDEYGIRFPAFERLRTEGGSEVDSLDRCLELLN